MFVILKDKSCLRL